MELTLLLLLPVLVGQHPLSPPPISPPPCSPQSLILPIVAGGEFQLAHHYMDDMVLQVRPGRQAEAEGHS